MCKKRFYKFLFLILSISLTAHAQVPDVDKLTDAQIEQFIKEADANGLTEAEVETLAAAKGYSPTDIAKVRERINRIKTGTESKANAVSNTERVQIGELAERTDTEISDKEEVGKKKQVYGYSLFKDKNLTFAPNLRLPTPPDYILGAGDELKVDISGYAYQHYDLLVSPEGTVKLESLSPIYVNGLTVKEAKNKITERLKTLYAGLRNGSLTVDVTLGNVRSISVTLLGEVENPGNYTVSSLATAFNALYLSGGPNSLGSLRNIQVFRNNRPVATIDIYELLQNGSLSSDIRLNDGDVIMIPVATKKVEVSGEVRRPMAYELQPDESLAEVLKLAGGYTEQAYTKLINIKRNTDKERRLITISGEDTDTFLTQNGDIYTISPILDRFENRVEIIGAVFRPGEYALSQNLSTVKQLINQAEGLREDAFLSRAILVREQANADPEFVPLNIGAIMRGEQPDIQLQKEDQLIIKSIVEIRAERTVSIEGAVNTPGTFDYVDGMTVKDLILLSGGPTDGATNKRLEVARRIKSDDTNENSVEVITLTFDNNLIPENEQIKLLPYDKIFVRSLANYEVQQIVTISGEVKYPGNYAIEKRGEKISDLIQRAGGLRVEADLNAAKFHRNGKQVVINLPEALENKENSQNNLLLENDDKLHIPKAAEIVSFKGEFLNPIDIAFQPDYNFQDYIAQAGGFTDSASVKRTYVVYANGLTDRTRSFLGFRIYPKVERGMTVYTPTRRKNRWTNAEVIAISTGLVSLSAVLLTLIRLL